MEPTAKGLYPDVQDIAMILDTAVTASTLQPIGTSAPNPLHLHLQPPAALQQSLDRCVACQCGTSVRAGLR